MRPAAEVPHRESLRRLHLVDHAFRDPHFEIIPRAIDRRWNYHKVVPLDVSGFNPFVSAAMVYTTSRFSEWSKCSLQSARSFNKSDALVPEVLWFAHDYLHAWAYRAIHALRPQLGLATQAIGRSNFEDFVFAHLVTEAAAVVGLDYWFLSEEDINERCPIGTDRDFLAVTYRERDLPEYRRFNRRFSVQLPKFFQWICRGYMSGRYEGFAVEDLERSPKLFRWLKHELQYGIKQRRYIRQWLHYLAGRPDWLPASWDEPAPSEEPWKKDLIIDLADALWAKVKKKKDLFFSKIAARSDTWCSRQRDLPDFRFVNAACVPPDELPRSLDDVEFRFWFYQYLSACDYESFDPDLMRRVPELLQGRDVVRVVRELSGQRRIKPSAREPRDLMMLS